MSLDVYLYAEKRPATGSGIFFREGGQTVELTREEWDAKFPGREPVIDPVAEEDNEVYWANITHNLGAMARDAGVYEALWRPAEMDPARAARIREQQELKNYDGAYEIEREATIHARDLIEPLQKGLSLLRSDPERFKAFNPENGWGSYDGLVSFVSRYLHACIENPNATVAVSR